MNNNLNTLKNKLDKDIAKFNVTSKISFNQLILIVNIDYLVSLLSFLKNDEFFSFDTLIDVTAIDNSELENHSARFTVVYNLLSTTKNHRLKFTYKTLNDIIEGIKELDKILEFITKEKPKKLQKRNDHED